MYVIPLQCSALLRLCRAGGTDMHKNTSAYRGLNCRHIKTWPCSPHPSGAEAQKYILKCSTYLRRFGQVVSNSIKASRHSCFQTIMYPILSNYPKDSNSKIWQRQDIAQYTTIINMIKARCVINGENDLWIIGIIGTWYLYQNSIKQRIKSYFI
jgi:hypothetical protein